MKKLVEGNELLLTVPACNTTGREPIVHLQHNLVLDDGNCFESPTLIEGNVGTGKTYLAAFDVAAVNPRRMLFVVHRERIAKDALRSFAKVVDSSKKLGLFVGNARDLAANYVFCTVQSLSRHLDEFGPHAFDYVVFDEAHHVGAGSYQRIATHFEPGFMLGMTATPARNDDFNVYDFFDNTIANLTPFIGASFKFSDIKQAIKAQEKGADGKIVVVMD